MHAIFFFKVAAINHTPQVFVGVGFLAFFFWGGGGVGGMHVVLCTLYFEDFSLHFRLASLDTHVNISLRTYKIQSNLIDHPKCQAYMVAYGRWSLTRGGFKG